MRLMSRQIENVNKEIWITKKKWIEILELKSTKHEIKKSLERHNIRFKVAEEGSSEFENQSINIIDFEDMKKKRKMNIVRYL